MHDACQLRVVRGTARVSLARKVPHGIHAREFDTAVFIDGRRNYVERVTTKGREPRLNERVQCNILLLLCFWEKGNGWVVQVGIADLIPKCLRLIPRSF